jgi:hypothetical protein
MRIVIGLRITIWIVIWGGRCGANSGPYGKTCRSGAVTIIRIGAAIYVRI